MQQPFEKDRSLHPNHWQGLTFILQYCTLTEYSHGKGTAEEAKRGTMNHGVAALGNAEN